jgi:nucleoside 2-deoxyribosyltransferase
MNPGSRCFVAMPFRPELNFFFLYIRQFLHERCSLEVERGDAQILTAPIAEKIRQQIGRADLVIADITGANPNVFYEVGLAHAANIPVLFLTQDPPEKVPVDIRQFEFILYDLAKHEEFLSRLESAIQGHFRARYDALYESALALLREFNIGVSTACEASPREAFTSLVMRAERTGGIPQNSELLAEFLLPKVIKDFSDPRVFRQYNLWMTSRLDTAAQQAVAGDAPQAARP